MKRTDKYKDSYKYDEQYRKRNRQSADGRARHERRESQEAYNRSNSRYRDDDPRYRNDDRRYQDDYDYREDYRRRNDEYDEDGNRYYNDRDFRREQQLEEENEKIRNLKMANCNYCNTVDYRSGICHKSNT